MSDRWAGRHIVIGKRGPRGGGSRAKFLIAAFTIVILSFGSAIYYKAGGQIKAGEPVNWGMVFHYGDLSFVFATNTLVALVYLAVASSLRRIMPEGQVAARYTLQFFLTAILGGMAAVANIYFYYRVLYDFPLPGAALLFDSALLAFITPVTLMATLETFHYRGAWLQEQFVKEQDKHEIIAAKLDALKNQLSPHFIFNGFNTLSALIGEQPDRAQQFLSQLAQVYRYVLDNKDRETVSLGRELDSVTALLHIQEARHPGAVIVDFIIAKDDRKLGVIPLTLHTLVENVFKHNVLSENAPISLKVEAVSGQLLVIENDLKPKLDVESHHIGIANLSKRYELLVQKGLKTLKTADRFRVEVPFVLPEAQSL